eukprot:2364208-Amphidinium_carterae.1
MNVLQRSLIPSLILNEAQKSRANIMNLYFPIFPMNQATRCKVSRQKNIWASLESSLVRHARENQHLSRRCVGTRNLAPVGAYRGLKSI